MQTAGIANARDVRPTKFKKKSHDEEKVISRPGETEDNWAEAANAEALAGDKSRQ